MKKSIFILLLFLNYSFIIGQTIKVGPYLQDANPTSIFISWETNTGTESLVEYGLSSSLGSSATGTNLTATDGVSKVHEVQLTSLTPNTKYYYRVKTGVTYSTINNFKTPQISSEDNTIRILAMSDMQIDTANPNIFLQIINNGVINYLNTNYGGDIADNLNMILIPGDLVASGTTYSQWEQHFFDPAQNLFQNVPVYPVLGNHEINSPNYFNYFHLPSNGALGYLEHSWYKDISNVRIIGIDSNAPYTNQAQLDWFDTVLASATTNPDIDFVIAQFHHPHKSELWTPGELSYSGQIVQKLEAFSIANNKPSMHLFGHTHGYSRGQSRDCKHIWLDVASAGGNIDYWGEFANQDYEQFTVTHDDYGFVLIEITNDANPKIVMKRISRGDENNPLDNLLRDTFTLYKNSSPVNTPAPMSPIGQTINPACVILKAESFSAPNPNAAHGQSHWQVSPTIDFESIVAQSWKNFENWYFEQNTQANDDLTDEKISVLNSNSNYYWRVRYRDKEFNWGEWSTPVTFSTGESTVSPNLVINPGAENGMSNWAIVEGMVEALTDGQCNGVSPHSGSKYFAVGGLCNGTESAIGRCSQNIDVSGFASNIDTGNLQANFGAYMRDWEGLDIPQIKIYFKNNSGAIIGSSNALSTNSTSWIAMSEWVTIPISTRTITVELKGVRNNGTDNDSYIDDIFLVVGSEPEDCGTLANVHYLDSKFKMYPNPFSNKLIIEFPYSLNSNTKIKITDILGKKVTAKMDIDSNKIFVERGNLVKGIYLFSISENETEIGNGKFIVE
jgi:hypothetical protein